MSRILLDMDGVLADLDGKLFRDTASVIQWPEEALKRNRRYCTDYLEEREARIVRDHIESTRFFRTLPVISGARQGVRELERMGFDLWVVSKPLPADYFSPSDKVAWIKDHFPTLARKVILTQDKSLVDGTILLDDAIKTREAAVASWAPVHYAYPHNSHKEGYRFTWHYGAGTLANITRRVEESNR